jgi:hypothetical protein
MVLERPQIVVGTEGLQAIIADIRAMLVGAQAASITIPSQRRIPSLPTRSSFALGHLNCISKPQCGESESPSVGKSHAAKVRRRRDRPPELK